MKSIILVYFLFTLVATYFFTTLIRTLRENKVEMPNGIHRFNTLGGHGLKTLMNSIKNAKAFIICYWGFIGLILLANFVQEPIAINFFILLWKGYILLSMSSYSYKFSEIKHLSDGMSRTLESDMFFIKYSIFGVLGILFDVALLILLKSSIGEFISILILFILIFILGMGDLLQVKNINRSYPMQWIIEPIRMIFGIPCNIIKEIFIKSHRKKFQNTLKHNLTHIFNGIKIGINKLK